MKEKEKEKKQKRYFYLWYFDHNKSKEDLISTIGIISFIVITIISSIIYYNIKIYTYNKQFERYSETALECFDEITTKVIHEGRGVDLEKIPQNIVDYEITYKEGNVILEYYIDKDKEVYMIITLSDKFEIISKEPNYSSKKEYIKEKKKGLLFNSVLIGSFIWWIIVATCIIGSFILSVISIIHKIIDDKINRS